jgi:hypothetical protein
MNEKEKIEEQFRDYMRVVNPHINYLDSAVDYYKMWLENIVCQERQAKKELIDGLKKNLKDMDNIDRICKIANVHPFTLMRKETEELINKHKEKE